MADWLAVDEVEKQFHAAVVSYGRRKMKQFDEKIFNLLPCEHFLPIESPLEAIFWIWWEAVVGVADEHSPVGGLRLDFQQEVMCSTGALYRLDFSIGLYDEAQSRRFVDAGLPFERIAIEVDGHGFHEKTPEQVALRNKRDRALQQDGWMVFHFSWSEMVADGEARVFEVVDYAEQRFWRCIAAARTKWEKDNPIEATKQWERTKQAIAENRAALAQ